ncbi:hypothetical protein LIER_01027 [Lithospermum erythrorhizon]|uniref:Uncharacterized protein n=1 Tax=Lithospermum erythrorhizon TaxID=34254 RepID=A0AAV3NKN8_LITER
MSLILQLPELSTVSLHVASHRRHFISRSNKLFQKLDFENNKRRIVRVRVCCSSLKELEKVEIVDLGEKLSLYGDFGAPVKLNASTSMKPSKEEEEKRNYYVNSGYAIRVLREEFPDLFNKELNFDIYRDDIVFKDPLNTFAGIDNYKSIFWGLRFHGRIFFRALWIDIVSVWQPVDNTIMIRWTVHGIPRVPWESRGRFDGTSEYKLDKNGKIYEHRVHNIALRRPPKFHVVTVQELIEVLSCPSAPKPTCFEIPSFSLPTIMPINKMSDIKHRLVSMLSFGQFSDEETSRR